MGDEAIKSAKCTSYVALKGWNGSYEEQRGTATCLRVRSTLDRLWSSLQQSSVQQQRRTHVGTRASAGHPRR